MAKITLWGMTQWMQEQQDDLFANLRTPAGMDASKLKDVILYHGAEFPVLYGDPNFMKQQIGIWSDKYEHTFERWVNALAIDYNPLENYDRKEEWNDTGSRLRSDARTSTGTDGRSEDQTRSSLQDHTTSDTGSHSENYTHTESGTASEDLQHSEDISQATQNSESVANDNNTKTAVSGIQETDKVIENTVSAFDSSSYQPDNMTDDKTSVSDASNTETTSAGTTSTDGTTNTSQKTDGSDVKTSEDQRQSSDTRTVNDDHATADTTTSADTLHTSGSGSRSESTEGSENEATAGHRIGRAHGNIGVTTSQQMLEAEWEVAKLNIYDEAADLFLSEFCLYVY